MVARSTKSVSRLKGIIIVGSGAVSRRSRVGQSLGVELVNLEL